MAIGQNDNHPDDYVKEDYNSERSKQWREHYKAFIEAEETVSGGQNRLLHNPALP